MTSEVLRRSSQGNLCVEDLQSNLRPLAYRLKLYSAVNERLRQLPSMCPQSIGTYNDRARSFVSLEERLGFARREEIEELLGEELRVAYRSVSIGPGCNYITVFLGCLME